MRTLHLARRDSNLRETVMSGPFSSREVALLRRSIDQCAYADNTEPVEFYTYVCLSGRGGENQVNEMAMLLNQVCLETVSHLRYITLIDAERLSIDAQRNMKSLMNRPGVVFMLVATRIMTIDEGVLDRCVHRIYFGTPAVDQWRSLAVKFLESTETVPNKSALDQIPFSAIKSFIDLYRYAVNAAEMQSNNFEFISEESES